MISGRGGYATRQEFFLEAVQNHVLEVKHGTSEGSQLLLDAERDDQPIRAEDSTSRNGNALSPSALELTEHPAALADVQIEPITDIERTALRCKVGGHVANGGIARFKKEPLLGLHNRDYPSLWAVSLLAELAHDDLVPAPMFVDEATRRAWRYAQALLDLEKTSKVKLTALFPTNTAKPQSAEEGFRAFAIGTIARKPSADGTISTSGPFFAWQVAQLVKPNGTAHIGLTQAGWSLAEAMQGLTLAWPHERAFAERFFVHLRKHAPWDWSGFEQVIEAVATSPSRAELTAHFGRWQPDWTDAMADTTSAGYVARAREWGVIEPKMTDGHYTLTEYGETLVTERSTA